MMVSLYQSLPVTEVDGDGRVMQRVIEPETKVLKAFKEWAVVVDVLGRGEQTVILRKGGIQEEGRRFTATRDDFFLFPTFEHQNPEDLEPLLQERLEAIVKARPREGVVPIEYLCSVEEVFKVEDLGKLTSIKKFHLWSANCVEKRFHWGRDKSLHVFLVRVLKLPERFELPMKESYGGCKSWVALESEVPMGGAKPVLSDAAFEEIEREIRANLA